MLTYLLKALTTLLGHANILTIGTNHIVGTCKPTYIIGTNHIVGTCKPTYTTGTNHFVGTCKHTYYRH